MLHSHSQNTSIEQVGIGLQGPQRESPLDKHPCHMFRHAQKCSPACSENMKQVIRHWPKFWGKSDLLGQYTASSSEKYLDSAQNYCGPKEKKKDSILLRENTEDLVNCEVKKKSRKGIRKEYNCISPIVFGTLREQK